MILYANVKKNSTNFELHNIYYLANPGHIQSVFDIDGLQWSFVFSEQKIVLELLSLIDPTESVQLILNCRDDNYCKSCIFDVDISRKAFEIDWESGSHLIQIEAQQIIEEEQLPGCDFSKPDDLSDAVLVVENEMFHVHSIFLSTLSPYFKVLFYGNFAEAQDLSKPILLTHVTPSGLRNLLNCVYAYPSNFRITKKNINDLLELANYYDFRNVTSLCEMYLMTSQSVTCSQKYQYAMHYNLKMLKKSLQMTEQ